MFTIFSFVLATIVAATFPSSSEWKAGTVVSEQDAVFEAVPIPDAVYERMRGCSLPENALISREELRYLKVVHYNFEGRVQTGELVCNKAVAEELLRIFRTLYQEKYQIEQMRLIDDFGGNDETSMRANNTSSFIYRVVAGTKMLSKHARGLAVDINPLYNPCVRGNSVEPATAGKYVDRSRNFPHKITSQDKACRLFLSEGWIWGGNWKSLKDWQHFEKKL